MSIQAVSWVLDHSEAIRGERLVLLAIANHYDFNDPALVVIAREARLSRSAVIRAIAGLEANGHLTVARDPKRGRSKKNHYTIPGYERSRSATIPFEEMVAFGEEMVAFEAVNGSAHATRTIENHKEPGVATVVAPDPRVSQLVGGYVDDYRAERGGHDPSGSFKASCGKAVKSALKDGVSVQDIARCLGVIAHESKNPSSLPYVLADYHAGHERRMR